MSDYYERTAIDKLRDMMSYAVLAGWDAQRLKREAALAMADYLEAQASYARKAAGTP